MAPDALRRLYDMGHRNDSDIVIGKVASNFRGVPHGVFRINREKCTIHDAPLVDSLTPHKMFRTAFLRDNKIAYPEGKRRLEDQLYMMQCVLPAPTSSPSSATTPATTTPSATTARTPAPRRSCPPATTATCAKSSTWSTANTEPGTFRTTCCAASTGSRCSAGSASRPR